MLSRAALVVVLLLTLAGSASAAEITVTRADDPVGGSCTPADCSLRQAVDAAQNGDIIVLGAKPHALTQGTQLTLSRSITLAGAGRRSTSIDGSSNTDTFFRTDRILKVLAGVTVTIRDITFSGGYDGKDEQFSSCSPCPTLNANGGGAIFNAGDLTLMRVGFEGNRNSPVGGAVSTQGSLSLSDVAFKDNAAAFGGALFTRDGVVAADRVTMTGNSGSARGGGAYLYGGAMLLTNSTVTGNGSASALGGGIANGAGSLTLRNVTLADNLRGSLMREASAPGITAENTIIGVGFGEACVLPRQYTGFATVTAITTDLGHNLDEDDSCGLTDATKIVGQSARLAPVADNGGSTPTMALLADSPALDAVVVTACSGTDQREIGRQRACDLGAFEAVQVAEPSAQTLGVEADRWTAQLNLGGEAGKLSFEYGLSPNALDQRTPGVGLGVIPAETERGELIPYLQPGRTYFFRALVENASGTARGQIRQYTAPGDRPAIQSLSLLSRTDTSVTIAFTIAPNDAIANYTIAVDGIETPLVAIAGPNPVQLQRTLKGFKPNSSHRLRVIASNSGGQTLDDEGIIDVETLRQITGQAGSPLTLTDTGVAGSCPAHADVRWGDGTTTRSTAINCKPLRDDSYEFTLTAPHTYAGGGRYPIAITYATGGRGALYAQVTPPADKRTLTVEVNGSGIVTGTGGIDCPSVCNVDLDPDTPVTLTATAGAGAQLLGWSSACPDPGTGPCSFRIDASTTSVTADFSGTAGPPAIGELRRTAVTATTASLAFLVNTSSLPTRYTITWPGGTFGPVAVAGAQSLVAVDPVVPGLTPDTEYDLTVTATNAYGSETQTLRVKTAVGDPVVDPTPTPTATVTPEPIAVAVQTVAPTPAPTAVPTPAPTAGDEVVLAPATGTVLVKLPGSKTFVALKAGQAVPYGTEVDTRKGRVTLTSVPKAGAAPQTAVFYDGLFKVSYKGGVTVLTLTEPLAPCSSSKKGSAAAKKAKSRKLWGDGKGAFRTSGKYSAATVRGTKWLVQDSCAGTLTRVASGVVEVQHRKKKIVLRAGKKYLAKA